jgi:murein DD-endopeptidase MepM/ murein hydrolase activator NlpD
MALVTAISGRVSDLGSSVASGNSEQEPAVATAGPGFMRPPVVVSTVPGILARHQAEAQAMAVPSTTPDATAAAVAETPAPAPVAATFVYTIQPGDTIDSIAAAFGLNPAYILWSNPEVSSDPDLLLVGETLIIPTTNGIVYHVIEGDTLSGIAAYYGIDVPTIVGYAGNGLSSADGVIVDGMVLVLPGAVPPAPAPEPEPVYVAEEPVADDPGPPLSAAVAEPVTAPVPEPSYGFIWPFYGNISTYFGPGHKGIDIDGFGRYGAAIAAAGTGTVVLASWSDYGLGYHVIIDHGDGYRTVYAHLSEIWVSQGEYVGQGQAVGALGSTGYSTGPHLHFEVHLWGSPVDPLAHLP